MNLDDRLESKDAVAARIPVADHPITYNEWHAAQFGMTGCFGGVSVALGVLLGSPALVALGVVWAMAATAWAWSRPSVDDRSMSRATLALEPWYFVVSLTAWWLGGVVGVLLVDVII